MFVAATMVICAVSLLINARYGASFGITDFDKWIYASAAVAIDVCKFAAPFALALALYQRQWLTSLIALIMFSAAVSLSMFAAIGFSFETREQVAFNKQATNGARSSIERQLQRVRSRLDAQPSTRASGVVEAEIEREARLRQRGWRARREGLKVELAAARNTEMLIDEEERLASSLAVHQPKLSHRAQSRAISTLLPSGWGEASHLDKLLAIMFAAIVEFFSAIGLYVARCFIARKPIAPTAAQKDEAHEAPAGTLPANDATMSGAVSEHPELVHLRKFKTDCVIDSPGSSVTAARMYDGYTGWCGREGIEPMTITRFGSLFCLFVVRSESSDRRRTYCGVKLRPGRLEGGTPGPPALKVVTRLAA